MNLHIENMHCAGCAGSVTKAIQAVDAGAVVTPHLDRKDIEVRTAASRAEVEAALARAGYPATAA